MAATGSSKSSVGRSAAGSSALANALLLALALGLGVWLLVARGAVSWPPHRVLAHFATVAGCLAACGPIVLLRRGRTEPALGDLLWVACGAILWIQAAVAVSTGTFRADAAATPLSPHSMALLMGTVLLSGWLILGAGKSWTWTNVLGWTLGLYWIVLGLLTAAAGTGGLLR